LAVNVRQDLRGDNKSEKRNVKKMLSGIEWGGRNGGERTKK